MRYQNWAHIEDTRQPREYVETEFCEECNEMVFETTVVKLIKDHDTQVYKKTCMMTVAGDKISVCPECEKRLRDDEIIE